MALRAFPQTTSTGRLADLLKAHQRDVLRDWVAAQITRQSLPQAELESQCREFLALLVPALATDTDTIEGSSWAAVREFLTGLSVSRAEQGFSPTETAMFVFSLKQSIFSQLRADEGDDVTTIANDMWTVTVVFDSLGLYTTEVYQRGREQVIMRQQQDMLELSTPVVMLWDGIVALPLIGT
ncbi:MAG TPA: RsbRD N-terminal domain-containing protein, partial [Gemmatimonadaceae bacterium]|nr:RsbRD N-terminal domain-containing protein [Gemmatimonadaceae bacterium]